MKQKSYLEKAINEAVIDYIAEKVIEKIINRSKRALLIFTGATGGFHKSTECLKKLVDDGWRFDALMSYSASKILPKDEIENIIKNGRIYGLSEGISAEKLSLSYDFIIIPTLSVTTAAKIAVCISDNLITNVITQGIMYNKMIIAVKDAACPKCKEKANIGFKANENYKNRLKKNLEDINSYGIRITLSENLCAEVNKCMQDYLRNSLKINQNDCYNMKNVSKSYCHEAQCSLDKKVIGAYDIREKIGYKNIKIKKDSIVTQLAADEAEKMGIQLLRE